MIRRSLAVCAILVLTSSVSLAQTGGGSTSGGGGSTSGGGGSTSGGGGSTSGGGSTGGRGTTGGGGGGNSATSGGLGSQTLNLTGAGSGTPGIAASSSLNASNAFSRTVGNPLYAGRVGATATTGPGGFGQPTYAATNSTAARGAAGGVGTGTGAVTVGGRTGAAGGTSFTPTTANSTIRVRYAANLKFPSRPVSGSELQGQLREILDTSTSLSAPGRVSVVVEDRLVILRGSASDDDERRLIEGMLRMTPGVREIRNELQIP